MKKIVKEFYMGSFECREVIQKAEYMVIRTEGGRQEAFFAETEEDVASITVIWQIEPEVDYDVYELNEEGRYVPWKDKLEGSVEKKGMIRKIRMMLKLMKED